MSKIDMGLKNSNGESALVKCVFPKGWGNEVCYSVSASSAFSQFLLHPDELIVICCP